MAEPIIISNFQNETAKSAYLGFEEIRCLDTKNKPGAILPSDALTKESASTIDEQITATAVDSAGVLYGITGKSDTTDTVFKRTKAGVWSELSGFGTGSIYGIAYWKGYIILIHSDGKMDATDDGGSTWSNNFEQATNNSNDQTPTILAQDDALYICQGNDVDKLVEDTTFDPDTPSTFTMTNAALDLPTQYEIVSVVALGDDLMFGCVNADDRNDATIFPWDRVSASFVQPIRIKEDGIAYMKEVENLVYVCAGRKGRWYVTNGTSVQFLAEIPKTMFDLTDINLEIAYHDAVAYNDGLIYFGVSNNNAHADGKFGVYSLNPKTGKINYAHIISTGETGLNDGVRINCITKVSATVNGVNKEILVVCWNDIDASSFGADGLPNTKYTGDKAFFTTQFLSVGTNAQPRSFERPEVRLARPLVSGDSFKVYVRSEQNGTWTLHYEEARVGKQVVMLPALSDYENIQLKVVLNNTTELLELRLE